MCLVGVKMSFKEILNHVDMEEFLEIEGIPFKKTPGAKGTQLNIKECPVCGDTRYKVYLNANTGLGNCFAGDHPIGENYNKYTFISEFTGKKGKALHDYLTHIAGDSYYDECAHSYEPQVMAKVALPESVAMPNEDGWVHPYLLDRGINARQCRKFGLRYCASGIFEYEFGGQKKLQDYSQRILIPVVDHEGNLISFQGRDITDKSKLKYMNPPGVSLTGSVVYNANACIGYESIILSEGAFDVLSVERALVEYQMQEDYAPCGLFSCDLSAKWEDKDQLTVLLYLKSKGVNQIIMMFDNQGAAIKKSWHGAEILASYGFDVRIAKVPYGEDPGSSSTKDIVNAIICSEKFSEFGLMQAIMG